MSSAVNLTTPQQLSDATNSYNRLDRSFNNTTVNESHYNTTSESYSGPSLTEWQIVLISLGVILLVCLTVGGNLLVLISFKINTRLQTVSNYFLLSLAVADLMIGLVSMPLYTMFLIMGTWPLGTHVCDLWLCLDYTISNASVANLLIICFDRYLSVTRPLTYMAKRTPRRAGLMIAFAWIIPVLLWAPLIFLWPIIEGKRTIPDHECAVQFLNTSKSFNQVATIITSIAAFYLPVTVMAILYYRIFLETKRRRKELKHLQAGPNISNLKKLLITPLSNHHNDILELENEQTFSDKFIKCLCGCCEIDHDSGDMDSAEPSDHFSIENEPDPHQNNLNTRSKIAHRTDNYKSPFIIGLLFRNDSKTENVDTPPGYNHKTEILECITTSFNERVPTPEHHSVSESKSNTQLNSSGPVNDMPVCTHRNDAVEGLKNLEPQSATGQKNNCDEYQLATATPSFSKPFLSAESTPNEDQPNRLLLVRNSNSSSEETCSKPTSSRYSSRKTNRKTSSRQDTKAAKTLSAILFAFICTWSPYMLFTLINTFIPDVIPAYLYNIGYWLCYINSTINPVCYALCNYNFRLTFTQIITCKLQTRRRPHYINNSSLKFVQKSSNR